MRARRGWFHSFFDAEYLAILKRQMPAKATRAHVDFVVRALRLKRGDRVLDVACGFGRAAAELARRGMRVVGVDLSPAMLRAAERRRGVEYVRMDMRRLPYRAEFDGVMCLFTSFGYFSPAENLATLKRMVRAARPGARIFIDHRDPAWVKARASPNRWWKVGDRYILEAATYDPRRFVSESRWLILRPKARRTARKTLRVQMWDRAAWRKRLARAGARLVRFCTGYDGSTRRAADRPRLLVVAERRRNA